MDKKFVQTILELDKNPKNQYKDSIRELLSGPVKDTRLVEFVMFTCSTIQASKLYSDKPWEYVSLDTSGNNLEKDISNLRRILEQINDKTTVKLSIIIGNTDPYYIYLQQFKTFSQGEKIAAWEKFAFRWKCYRNNFKAWVKKELPDLDIEIISWYELEKDLEKKWRKKFEDEFDYVYKNIDLFFYKKDLTWELTALSNQFGAGKYFTNLKKPKNSILDDWVKRKFAEYAVQGAWLKRYLPNAILIQNEKPSFLRSKMYQPWLKKQTGQELPIIYFFEVDNLGYA